MELFKKMVLVQFFETRHIEKNACISLESKRKLCAKGVGLHFAIAPNSCSKCWRNDEKCWTLLSIKAQVRAHQVTF